MTQADTKPAERVATSANKAAEYTLKKLTKEGKSKAIFDDLEAMMLSMMLACELPPDESTLEEDEDAAGSNDENATRRNRRNRRDKQRRNRRNSREDPRRLRTRQRYRRVEDELPTA